MVRLSKEDGFQKTNETLNEVNSKVEAYEKYLAYCNSLLDEMDRKWKKVSGMEGLEKTNASMEKQNMKLNNSIPKDEENLSKNVSAFRDLGNDSQGAKEGVEGATKALSNWKVQLGLSIGKGAIKLVKNFYEKFKSAFKKVQDVTKQFEKKFTKAMKSISHVFRYMIMRMSFRALLKDWQFFFNKYLEFSEPFLQSFNELYNAVLRVTASLITAFAPVIRALQPVITSLANAVRYLLNIIAQFNAVFFLGSDNYDRVKDFWVDYSDLLDKAGGSAKKAGKQLAAFDTINKLGSDSGGGSKSTLDDLLNPEDIYENSPLSEFWRNIKNMFEQKKFKDIGASFADAFNTWVDNALTVFDEGNFSEKLNGKIDGVRQALTSFFSKINEDPDGPTGPGKPGSYKLGTLAGKIVNMISSGIITALTDDDGTTWYGEFARAIGLFLQGAIDEIKFEDLGMVVISLRNMINRFWTEFWGTLNEEVLDENGNSTGQTYAQKLGDGLATAFNTAIENWDMEAEIGKTVEKFTAIIDAAIEFLDNAKIFEGAMKRGYAVGNAMGQLAGKVIELFGKALWAAVKDITGYVLGALIGGIDGAAENAKDDSLLEASAKALVDALGVIIGAALVAFWPGLIGKAIGGALMLACGVDFLGNQKGMWTEAFEGLGEDAATSVEDGMMNEDTGMRTVLDNVFGTTVAYAAELEPTVEEEFKAVGEGATEAMGEPMLNEDTGVLSKLNTLFDSVKTAISDKQSSTEEQGKSWGGWIVSGLASGLSAGLLPAGPLMTALTSLSGTIASKFTKFFEIGSPSKLFERYGGWIIEGLNNGLQGEDVDTGFTKSLSGLDTENQEIANSVLTTWNDFKLSLEEIFVAIGDMIKTQLEMVVTMLNVTMHTVQSGLNNMVSALNDVIEDYNRAAKEAGGRTISYVGYVRLEDIPIPKLASGAVIPPNNEFLAVLGDQKHGTNIEAPLETIKQAVAEVLGNGRSTNTEVILEVDGREFGRAVVDLGAQENRRVGTRFITA